MKNLFERIMDPTFYKMLFIDKTGILQAKKDMLESACKLFRDWFSQSIRGKDVYLICVPNSRHFIGIVF